MSNANIIELQSCLDDCLAYCANHPERDHSRMFSARLANARKQLDDSLRTSDRHFTNWANEEGEDRLAWKHLAKQLASTQTRLRQIQALGYPDRRVMYWDTEILEAAVRAMIAYLAERTDQIDFAREHIDKLERQLERCFSENKDSDEALRNYRRFAMVRADGIREAADTIGGFRRTMRRDLGIDHPDYKAIRWPFSVATDEPVL